MQIFRVVMKQLDRLSLRLKVALVFLLITGLFVIRFRTSTEYFLVELQGQENVSQTLNNAHMLLYNHIDRFDCKFTGLIYDSSAMNPDKLRRLYNISGTWEANLRPDLFLYVDSQGKVVYSGNKGIGPPLLGRQLLTLPVVQDMLAGKKTTGFAVIPPAILEQEGLLPESRITLQATPNAQAPRGKTEDRAMAIVSGIPVYSGGKVTGAFLVGQILNKKHDIVDAIDRNFHSRATIFLDEVRISTTVPDKNGQRAIGTLISDQVGNKVLYQGQKYFGRAFVVNDWYITAYEPIRDTRNHVIGSLYVGIKEAPLLAKQKQIDNDIKYTLIFVGLVSLVGFYWLDRSVINPIYNLSKLALRFAKGEMSLRFPTSELVRCWDIKNCHQTDCPLYGNMEMRCWLAPETAECCAGEQEKCQSCKVYRHSSGTEFDRLADAFNFTAVAVQEYTGSLHDLNLKLEEKNRELIDQKDELECQKEQLEALNAELEESMKALDDSQSIIYALAVAVEAKDPYTRGHSERVAGYSVNLATALGLPPSQFETIRGAALLHDIGKIGISGSILRKPGYLTKQELQQIKKHPTIGERICASLKFAQDILPIIKHHHEHYDGKGYPDGLKGDKIPITARIVAIADAFDAMTSDRPYREGMDPDEALAILEGGAGQHWDPRLVPVFIRLIQEQIKEMNGEGLVSKQNLEDS